MTNDKRYPRATPEVVDELRNAFSMPYIIKRSDLNSDQKIAVLMILDEVYNYLETCSEEANRSLNNVKKEIERKRPKGDTMGFIGKIVSSVLSPFFGGMSESNPTSIPQPAVKASDLVPSTAAATPEAPVIGDNTNTEAVRKKKVSRKSLLIDQTSNSNTTNSNGLNL